MYVRYERLDFGPGGGGGCDDGNWERRSLALGGSDSGVGKAEGVVGFVGTEYCLNCEC